jgi:hypothetical protein
VVGLGGLVERYVLTCRHRDMIRDIEAWCSTGDVSADGLK